MKFEFVLDGEITFREKGVETKEYFKKGETRDLSDQQLIEILWSRKAIKLAQKITAEELSRFLKDEPLTGSPVCNSFAKPC